MELLAGAGTTTSECAEDIGCPEGGPCSSEKILQAIEGFADAVPARQEIGLSPLLPTEDSAEAEAVRAAAAALNCNSESCVIKHPKFRTFAVRGGVTSQDIKKELDTRFKAEGPRDSLALLSNTHIDATMQRWARLFPEFFPCPFAMMDFDRTKESFATIDILNVLAGKEPVTLGSSIGTVMRPCTCFGCVVNTDVSSGRGKHWVAVFVDCRGPEWTVEYFNSAGNPPPRPMTEWLTRTCVKLCTKNPTTVIVVTDLDHQESQTECGLYAMYYIRRRLEGTPVKFFFEQLVPDAAMTAFRQHVFRIS